MCESYFYDEYVDKQLKSAFNLRHFILINETKKHYTPKKNVNILEIGCGIGVLSYMLQKALSKINLYSIDASSKSIETAKKINKQFNTQFFNINANMISEKFANNFFDLIILYDVMEHIEKEKHYDFFSQLKTLLADDGRIFINIPNPEYLEYMKENNYSNMQPIEEEVGLKEMEQLAKKNALVIKHYYHIDIWKKDESCFYILTNKKSFVPIDTNKKPHIHNRRQHKKYFRSTIKPLLEKK
jgi:trans-aconitate 2-methyltransferase